MGKGANGGPEDVGDPGDFGGPDFKPPKEPSPKEKALLAVVAGTLLYDNIPNNDTSSNRDKKNSANNKEAEVSLKKGK